MKNIKSILFIMMFVFALFGNTVQPARAESSWYVASYGTAADACTEADPCSFKHAVDLASNDDSIYMAVGNYTSAAGDEVLFINKGLNIIGGCLSDFSTCSPLTVPSTTIDGQQDRRGITIQGTGVETVKLRNLVVKQGDATGIDSALCPTELNPAGITVSGCGGGLFASHLAGLEIRYSKFLSHEATLDPVAAGYGGALFIEKTGSLYFAYNQISNSTASVNDIGFGGGLFLHEPSDTTYIIDNTFDTNDCTMVEPDSKGCHAFINRQSVSGVYLFDNTFSNGNSQPTLNIQGSAIYFRMNRQYFLQGNTFQGQQGSSVITANDEVFNRQDTIKNNTFWNNPVLDIIQITGANGTRIYNNFFGYAGTALKSDQPTGGMRTAISLTNLTGSSDICFNTFAKLDRGVFASDTGWVTVKNNIFAYLGNYAISTLGSVSTIIDRNLFYQADPHISGTHALVGVYNPQLVDPANGDFHLLSNSAAIDMALEGLNVDDDIDGDARPVSQSDLGADEAFGQYYLPAIFH